MLKWVLIIGAMIVGVVFIVGLSVVGMYNGLVAQEETVKTAWSQVENVYQRRSDLIPNLVATVKGYAVHEHDTFVQLANARASVGKMDMGSVINDPEKFAQFQKAQGEISSALTRLLVSVEAYPTLKANEGFLALQSQLEGTENRITIERQRYNEAAKVFGISVRRFPTNILAGIFGFKAKAYFEAEQGSKEVPKVKF